MRLWLLLLCVLCLAGLWEDASFKLHGNLFWPDFWPPGTSSEAQDVVYDMVGLEATKASVSSICFLIDSWQCILSRWICSTAPSPA